MDEKALTRLSDSYTSSSSIPTLIQLAAISHPWMNVLTAPIAPILNRIREERMRTFFDALAEGEIELTDEMIQSENFLHYYHATASAAFKTRQREKIRWFAHLLLAGARADPHVEFENEYEDLLKVLDDTTYRELGVLAILAELEERYPLAAEDAREGNERRIYLRAHRIWNPDFGNFEKVACVRIGLLPSELQATLTRLTRTGLYRQIITMVSGYTGNLGTLTPLYYRLANIIRLQGIDWMKTANESEDK